MLAAGSADWIRTQVYLHGRPTSPRWYPLVYWHWRFCVVEVWLTSLRTYTKARQKDEIPNYLEKMKIVKIRFGHELKELEIFLHPVQLTPPRVPRWKNCPSSLEKNSPRRLATISEDLARYFRHHRGNLARNFAFKGSVGQGVLMRWLKKNEIFEIFEIFSIRPKMMFSEFYFLM